MPALNKPTHIFIPTPLPYSVPRMPEEEEEEAGGSTGFDRSIDRPIGWSVGFVNEAVYAEHDIAYSDNLAPLVRIMRETEYTRSYYTRSTDL